MAPSGLILRFAEGLRSTFISTQKTAMPGHGCPGKPQSDPDGPLGCLRTITQHGSK